MGEPRGAGARSDVWWRPGRGSAAWAEGEPRWRGGRSGADERTVHVHVGGVMLTGGDEGRVDKERRVTSALWRCRLEPAAVA